MKLALQAKLLFLLCQAGSAILLICALLFGLRWEKDQKELLANENGTLMKFQAKYEGVSEAQKVKVFTEAVNYVQANMGSISKSADTYQSAIRGLFYGVLGLNVISALSALFLIPQQSADERKSLAGGQER